MKTEFAELRHRLSKNPRVQRLVEKAAAPQNEMRTKNFNLTVKCAADFPVRIAKLDELIDDLHIKKMYANMSPTDVHLGAFEVREGFEGAFRELARDHGFNASEVISCE